MVNVKYEFPGLMPHDEQQKIKEMFHNDLIVIMKKYGIDSIYPTIDDTIGVSGEFGNKRFDFDL